jgi:hypothetical protein
MENFNTKANWANLLAGVALLALLVWGSLRFFSGTTNNGTANPENLDQVKLDLNGDGKSDDTENKDENGSQKDLGTGGPVDTLPNTSSK